MKKIFLLGVGAQKCGTTWLYNYLKNHKNTEMGFLKEYHIFDALHIRECKNYLDRRLNLASKIINDRDRNKASQTGIFKLLDFYIDTQSYYNYFSSILSLNSSTYLTGDITPSYSGLSHEVLKVIGDQFTKRSIETKTLFSMRDPVSRCISAAKDDLKKLGKPITKENTEALLNQRYESPEYQLRTRYDKTIENLELAFERDDIFYCFYEELFNESTIRQLCIFLRLPYYSTDFAMRVNSSSAELDIDENIKKNIFKFYEPTYVSLRSKFGEARINELWTVY